jgi:hypothetical protein
MDALVTRIDGHKPIDNEVEAESGDQCLANGFDTHLSRFGRLSRRLIDRFQEFALEVVDITAVVFVIAVIGGSADVQVIASGLPFGRRVVRRDRNVVSDH